MENDMTLQRLYNIAQTGQTAEPTAVDNIMAQYQPKKQEGGFWNGLKNFAGSDVGRMLIGGLGTAAAVGLSGGNGKDALRYGLMGAGSTMQSIDSRNRYRDKLMKEQQDRADKLAEAEKLRQHQLTMQANTIKANEDAATTQFERRMQEIADLREYNEQQKANDKQLKIDAINSNPYLSDEQKAWQISQIDIPEFNNDAYYGSMLVRDPNNQDALNYFTNKAKLQNIINPTKPTSAFSQDLNTLVEKYGMTVQEALDYLGKHSIDQQIELAGRKAGAVSAAETPYTMAIDNNKSRNTLNNDITMAGINHDNDVALEDLKHNYDVVMEDRRHNNALAVADNKLKNDINFETYKRNLTPERIIEAEYTAQSLQEAGYDVTAGDILYQGYKKDVLGNANTVANIGQTLASTDKTKAEIPFVGQTSEMKNYNFLQKNPDAVNSPVFAKSGDTINVNTGDNISGGINSKKLIEKTTEAYSNARENYRESMASRDFTNRAADNLIASLERDPSVVGAYSGWNEKYQRYIGDNKDWLSKRGEVVRQINDIANILIQQANKSGVTGINTVAEVERIVGNINPNSSASEIKGALAKLKAQSEELARKSWDTLQSFNNPLPEYSPYVAQANQTMGQPVQSVGGFIIERME